MVRGWIVLELTHCCGWVGVEMDCVHCGAFLVVVADVTDDTDRVGAFGDGDGPATVGIMSKEFVCLLLI